MAEVAVRGKIAGSGRLREFLHWMAFRGSRRSSVLEDGNIFTCTGYSRVNWEPASQNRRYLWLRRLLHISMVSLDRGCNGFSKLHVCNHRANLFTAFASPQDYSTVDRLATIPSPW